MNERNTLTLGSLFDGSGGFPLGGLLAGIAPLWASEIEPFPIRVTTKRLPFMKHYGDISAMDGSKVEPVDIITFGSPCTDMSVAGKRAGLDGDQSVLFYQAIRIIKEMRRATNGEYPRYIVWENVPGAFFSNGGQDFKAVLEAVVGIMREGLAVPMPENGRWPYADLYMGDGWSIAYRTLDAQYWGVPQRRRRIYLVADFAGGSAGEILFESEGVSGYSQESFRSWQRAARGAAKRACPSGGNERVASTLTRAYGTKWNGNEGAYSGGNFAYEPDVVLNDQGGSRMDVTRDNVNTLRAEAHHPPCVVESAGFCTEHSAKARSIGYEEETSPTLRAGTVPAAIALENHAIDGRIKIEEEDKIQTLTKRMGTGGMNVPLVMKIRCGCEGGGKGPLIQENKSATLSCNNDQTLFEPCSWDGGQTSPTLTAKNAGGNQRMPDKQNFNCVLQAFGICSDKSNSMLSDNPHSGIYEAKAARTIDGNGGNPGCNQGGVAIVEPIPFTQNQRDEVRELGGAAGAISAEPGMKQQTFVLQGSMIGREDKNGPQGDGVNEDVSFTLNTIDRHAVYAMTTGGFTQVGEESAPTLLSRDYKDAPVVTEPSYGIGRDAFNQGRNALYKPAIEEELQPTLTSRGPGAAMTRYTIRRLTPTECARLQGFPDGWCDDLKAENPSYGDIDFWTDVWETHRRITGTPSKPKSEAQIRKWLKEPNSDAAEYKMWGNGVALPCVYFVLSGVAWAAKKDAQILKI